MKKKSTLKYVANHYLIHPKNQKGITLVALVITIIVLIILAGVTLNIVLDKNGIINKSEYATEETEKEALKEEIYMAVTSSKMEDALTESSNLEEELQKISNATVSNLELKVGEESQTEAYYVEKNKIGYTVYKDGSIEEGKTEFWDGTTQKPDADGEKNWHIYTAGQMKYFAEYCTSFTDEDKAASGMPAIESTTIVYLENNIDMGARQENGELKIGEKWTPIENFGGIFDGNNHSIRGIYVQKDTNNAGIFGSTMTSGTIIKNLTIKNSYIIGGGNYTGGIISIANAIENCHSEGVIITGSTATGGVAGFVKNEIKDCSSNSTVKGNGWVGGIARRCRLR